MTKIYQLHEKYCMMPETDYDCPFTKMYQIHP
jgi:hypothetical protein